MQPNSRSAELIDRLIADSLPRLPKGEAQQIETFLRQYYIWVAPEDLSAQSLIDLRGAALAHWHLARDRMPGVTKVHVYNPQFEKHGWQSTHTIVQTVTDDMPFLVDSVSMAINRAGLTIHLTIHPVVKLRRNAKGRLVDILPPATAESEYTTESFMQFQVDRQTDRSVLEALQADIERVVKDVRLACSDWQPIRDRVTAIIRELEEQPPPVSAEERAEAAAFLRWIEADHFSFLGYCEYDLKPAPGGQELQLAAGSTLGILRDGDPGTGSTHIAVLPTQTQTYSRLTQLVVVTKANSRSTVHRPAYMDFIGVKRFDTHGEIDGERCILGLFTSAAYNRHTRDIPLLRQKAKRIFDRSGLSPTSHAGKALQNVIETYPRDGLFQISEDDLFAVAMGTLELQERQRIRLFVRRDAYGRFYSCLVYVPRDRVNRELRTRFQEILLDAFNGTGIEFHTLFSESVLARIHFVVHTDPAREPSFDVREIEARIVDAARSWQDNLRDALIERCGEERGIALFHKYGDGFPVAYRADFAARTGAIDIERIEAAQRTGEVGISFYRPLVETGGGVRLKLYSSGKPIPPSDALPLIENMDLKVIEERPYEVSPRQGEGVHVWVHEMQLLHARGLEIDPEQVAENFQDALARVWRGDVENDGFNRLVLGAGLNWRETVMLRAYAKYLLQLRIPFSGAYMIESLTNNPRIARLFAKLFRARFDPARAADADDWAATLVAKIERRIDSVASLDEDRILRGFLNVIQATVRTNYFRRDPNGQAKTYLSFKIDTSLVSDMPAPRPMFEIFVYSPRTEGVHLRGGRVARGGLRWSDRREDFRTEVLGLMKAQMVKNAVIVPVGAKGGFVVKRPPGGSDRSLLQQEVVHCYSTLVRGMLDLTDNLRAGAIVPPPEVVRYDGDDPYLVVAADKGTATFSDIANGIAEEYGFWLGDAFASGGSAGYDHKKMGITARGAWESVKRHFRELGIDIQKTDFTVVSIGDMAGDVFGNGMLLSRHIKLVGAFNHLHIFLDPNPDPVASYRERERLFRKPSSTWLDYNQELISKGGGVYARSAKSIPLSPEVQELLRVQATRMTPNELINALLKARVDLLWNGGIGTFVKAETETHADVRDRANDTVRVNGRELACRVVGEGGNLGLTQLGRVEYARKGGRLYTDFIDNSAGVDCSDHEVNIKILLNAIVASGDMTRKQRDKLLADMTDEVAELVLGDNYGQSQAISIAVSQAPALLTEHVRFIRHLERRGKLDREAESLPTDKVIADRLAAGEGLTRPEIALLLAYGKITLYQELLASDVPEDPYLSRELRRHFPQRLGERFGREMDGHRLRREIIATHITNSLVNRVGPTFAFRLSEQSGASAPDIARAYTAAREIFGIRDVWTTIEDLDNQIAAQTQLAMLIDTGGLIERATLWLLRNRRAPLDIAGTVAYFQEGVRELWASAPKPLAAVNRLTFRQRLRRLTGEGVPVALATRVAGLVALSSALDIVDVAKAAKRDVCFVASLYFALGARLELQWLREQISALKARDHWHTRAKWALRNDLHNQQRNLTAEVLRTGGHGAGAKAMVQAWVADNQQAIDRFMELIAEMKAADSIEFPMLAVALSGAHGLLYGKASPVPAAAVRSKALAS